MPNNPIQIKDILIQGNRGQRMSRLRTATESPAGLNPHEIREKYGAGYSIVAHGELFYRLNPDAVPSVLLIENNAENNQYIDKLLQLRSGGRFDDIISPYELSGFQSQTEKLNRLESVFNLIQSIASQTAEQHTEKKLITRSITDEFTFYPSETPFTLEEYKQIIERTSDIAQNLPPDVHLVLATFPVLWPDGGIHNCGLYVQSPTRPGHNALIHHFSKINHHDYDPVYQQSDGTYYINSAVNNTIETSPDEILKDTKACTHDNNQYESAIHVTRSDGKNLIVSLGICFDHGNGVERNQVHHLIDQLKTAKIDVPLQCNHVITSASIAQLGQHTLSTISHADPAPHHRRPVETEIPGRSGFTLSSVNSSFSGTLTAEIYPEKLIGTLHSDLFLHAVSDEPKSLPSRLNARNDDGNTMLHQVFLESINDRELIAKRLFSMIIHGGDPALKNALGKSVFELAEALDKTRTDKTITTAILSALEWKEHYTRQNQSATSDGHTLLTRAILKKSFSEIGEMILSGSNPYLKDASGQSAMDFIAAYDSEKDKSVALNEINTGLLDIQYGYVRQGALEKLNEHRRYRPYIPTDLLRIKVKIRNGGDMELCDIINAIKLYPSNLSENALLQVNLASIIEAFKALESIKTIHADHAKTVYDAISFKLSQDKINTPTIDESQPDEILLQQLTQAMQSEFYKQWAPHLNRLISNTMEIDNLVSFLSTEEQNRFFDLIQAKLPEMIQKSSDLSCFAYLPKDKKGILFELIKSKLPDMIQTTNDLSVFSYLPEDKKSILFDLIKDKLPNMIQTTDDLLVFSYLPEDKKSILFDLIKDKLPDMLTENFNTNFIEDFSPQESMMILQSISEQSWEDIKNNSVMDCDVIINNTKNNPAAFIMLFEKLSPSLLESAQKDKKAYILRELSTSPPNFVQAINQEALPLLIQNCSIIGLRTYSPKIKELISNAYPPDNYSQFQMFLGGLDEQRKALITKSIGENFSTRFEIPSVTMKKTLQNFLHTKPNATPEAPDLDTESSKSSRHG